MRRAVLVDLKDVNDVTEAAYAPYCALFGASPVPMSEDYGPRIARGEVWLHDIDEEIAGLVVVEWHPDHVHIFSLAVSPRFQGRGHGGIASGKWRGFLELKGNRNAEAEEFHQGI